ncbi:Two component transcriptional regulator, LuxR family [Mycolicibacterium smegmatis MC2 155]|uniref:Two component transcriptional regulator, LuxR family n=2 Tax=Mycolicibacterium smegmatis TaxID=1772 RepID=I7G583_MYCS2|nr:Two component transcriptional regulator, LuxR family [Mycolicibacterium smegmatis MC2 155]CKH18944.1 LuxR family two component transcriptional regulator [Mycolicibacterium smegmatis]STZ33286.1 LuxR family two component transcriptional regulator [Mycolicibacterium smegmatis]
MTACSARMPLNGHRPNSHIEALTASVCPEPTRPARPARVELSAREQEILIAWLKSDSKTEVGKALHLAPGTVRTYLQRIRDKYERAGRPARTKAALVARAIQDGYVDVADL